MSTQNFRLLLSLGTGEICSAHGAGLLGYSDSELPGLRFAHLATTQDWQDLREALACGESQHSCQMRSPKGLAFVQADIQATPENQILYQVERLEFERESALGTMDSSDKILYSWLAKISQTHHEIWFEGEKAIAVFHDRRMAWAAWFDSKPVRDRKRATGQGCHIQIRYFNSILGDSEANSAALTQRLSRLQGCNSMATTTGALLSLTKLELPNKVLHIPDKKTLNQLVEDNPDLKVIQMSTGVGIATGTNGYKTSGLTPQQWVGRNMAEDLGNNKNTWIPEEYKRFQGALLDHIIIDNFQYRAHLYDGTLCQFTVNARLGTCENNGLVRLVESLDCTPI